MGLFRKDICKVWCSVYQLRLESVEISCFKQLTLSKWPMYQSPNLPVSTVPSFYTTMTSSFSLLIADLTVTAEVVLYVQAPPATVFIQDPQCQMPTARLFILVLPQNEQVYLACWLISIFFTILRSEAP